MKTAIRCSELRFAYPAPANEKAFSLHIPAWELKKGEQCVVYGPSGGGKSTFLNLVAGILAMQEGSLQVLDLDLSQSTEQSRTEHRIQNIGFVFQDYPLLNYLNAQENILLPYRLNPVLQLSKEVVQRAQELLKRLGLKNKGHRKPSQLSQGERQRVSIARALITQPQLILADEPTAGLDPQRSIQVMELLEGLVQEEELSLLLVTHDPTIMSRFSQKLNIRGEEQE